MAAQSGKSTVDRQSGQFWRQPCWMTLFAAVVLVGCGDAPQPKGPSGASEAATAAAKAVADAAAAAEAALDANYIRLGENPKWKPLIALFGDYNKRKIEALENPMLAHLVDHLEKPVIDTEREGPRREIATTVELEDGRPEDEDPRTWMALDRYKLIILMTGIARPKAVLTTLKGARYVLERGDPIGSEGGRVKAILQYKMLVAVPSETEPRVVSIEPPLAQLAEEAAVSKDF